MIFYQSLRKPFSRSLSPCLFILLLARLAPASEGAPRAIFLFESDSLQARLTRMGGAPSSDTAAGRGWTAVCDSLGPAARPAWFEVELIDRRAGTKLRFPVEAAALRQGLKQACREGKSLPPARIAAGLRAWASRLQVRMRAPEGETLP